MLKLGIVRKGVNDVEMKSKLYLIDRDLRINENFQLRD